MLEKTILSAAMMFEHHKYACPPYKAVEIRTSWWILQPQRGIPVNAYTVGLHQESVSTTEDAEILGEAGQWTPWSPCCLHPSGLWTHQILVRTCNHWMIISTSSHQQLIQHAIHCCVFGSSAKDSGSPERCSFCGQSAISIASTRTKQQSHSCGLA